MAERERELEIVIGSDGKVTARPIGAKGPECTHLADLLVQIIGREESRQTTSEFYEVSEETRNDVDVRQKR